MSYDTLPDLGNYILYLFVGCNYRMFNFGGSLLHSVMLVVHFKIYSFEFMLWILGPISFCYLFCSKNRVNEGRCPLYNIFSEDVPGAHNYNHNKGWS